MALQERIWFKRAGKWAMNLAYAFGLIVGLSGLFLISAGMVLTSGVLAEVALRWISFFWTLPFICFAIQFLLLGEMQPKLNARQRVSEASWRAAGCTVLWSTVSWAIMGLTALADSFWLRPALERG